MPSKFEQCIANGSYESVTAGEKCSLEYAKQLGISDSENYYVNGYEDLKTFNEEEDKVGERAAEICSQSKDGKKAYKSCTLQHGIGFARKPGYPNKCMTYDCPPGFEKTASGCKKPLQDYAITARGRCDERWHDWFMIPNYHLGNKYFSPKPGTCYKPCGDNNVPHLAKDPVDNSSTGFNASDKPDRCIDRGVYNGGKYAAGSDYCPLAWIHRLTASPSVVTERMNTELDELRKEQGEDIVNENFSMLQSDIPKKAKEISTAAAARLENLFTPTEDMVVACQTLNNADRLNYAYDVCKNLQEDDSWYSRQLEEEYGASEPMQLQMSRMLKQACNAIFCNPKDGSNELIGKPQLCLDVSGKVEQVKDDDEEDASSPPTADKQQSFFVKSIGIAIGIVTFLICMVVLYILFVYVIWPVVVWIYEKIRVLLGRIGKGKNEKQAEELKANMEASDAKAEAANQASASKSKGT